MTAVSIEVSEADGQHHVPRIPKSRGAGPFGIVPTVLLAIGVLVGLILMTLRFTGTGLTWLGGVAIFGLVELIKDHHNRGPIEKAASRIGWWSAKRAGAHVLAPGSLTIIGDYQVPGTAAESILTDGADAEGNRYAVLTYPTTGHHVVSFRANPDGAALVDEKVVTRQADGFANWLTGNGTQHDLQQAAITIEIAPDAYPALRREIETKRQKDAPAISQKILDQILQTYPLGGSTSKATISLTYKPSVDKESRKADGGVSAFRERLSPRLTDMKAALQATGAGRCALMNSDEVIETVRVAYNPGDRAHYQELRARGEQIPVMKWSKAGPAGAKEEWAYYIHGDGTSIVWDKSGFTNKQVAPRAMKPLLVEPPKGVHSVRVTWLFRTESPAKSGRIAESDLAAAEQRANSSRKPSARAKADLKAAQRTGDREAKGEGLVNFATIVTATVLNPDEGKNAVHARRRAESAVEHLGPSARLQLRVLHGSQAASFAQGLGVLGLVTAEHLNIPTALRKAD